MSAPSNWPADETASIRPGGRLDASPFLLQLAAMFAFPANSKRRRRSHERQADCAKIKAG
ncbi:hypothetical protein AJ88_07155 [Mesorhizobium amorphae CCBAU 01583]|nr:hypothetical protein AJ88_07155 [Mesorhizobium amorphae CCBAU 01583]